MVAFRRSVLLLFLLCESLTLCAFAADVDHAKVESLLKATYLYKFTDYVEWPASALATSTTTTTATAAAAAGATAVADAKSPTHITIGVIDADDVAAALNTLIAEHPDQVRKMSVKIVKPNESLADIQVLFIGHGSNAQSKDLLAGARDLPVLTVTAFDGALEFGSTINFVVIDGHIKFEISLLQATRSGLKISSRLLGIAQKVETGGK